VSGSIERRDAAMPVGFSMTRREVLAAMAVTLARAASLLPANKNVKWGLGSNLWNYFPRVPFTDILDVMKDTGFIGLRLTQFPQILKTYDITTAQMRKEVEKRGCHIVATSFNGPAYDPARRSEIIGNAKAAMNFLKEFGANEIGRTAREMGFYAGLHNHVGQMVQDPDEVDRCMAMTDAALFYFSPDTAHLYLAGCDVAKTMDKYRSRLMLADYKDAKRLSGAKSGAFERNSIFDLGDGEIDFPACHQVLKSISFHGWLIVDLDIARQGQRVSYQRCAAYVVEKLEGIYV